METVERIEKQINSQPIVLYMKGTPEFPQCGFSAQVNNALQRCGAEFGYVNILEDPEVRQEIKTYANWPTFPQLYINGELVGGCDIVVQLYESGELQELVDKAVDRDSAAQ